MTTATKRELIRIIQERYYKANRSQKTQILNEFIKTCQIHRKSAIRTLSVPLSRKKEPREFRATVYPSRLLWIVENWWRASGYMCGERLKASLDLWLPSLKRRFEIDDDSERLLRQVSPSTIDRRLRNKKRLLRKRLYGSTKPGLLLRHQIPIRTEYFDLDKPGYVEIDLVSHCGLSIEGEFAYTLCVTDVFSQWVERRCFLGKSERNVVRALEEIREVMPFKMVAIDSDNGSEFINHHLIRYCKSQDIGFTRSRPYKKDDQAHVEQKNFTHVRKIIGYGRIDRPKAIDLINDLYSRELKIYNIRKIRMKLIPPNMPSNPRLGNTLDDKTLQHLGNTFR